MDWLLAGVAARPSRRGKHPAGPMRGFDLEYADPPPNGRKLGIAYMRRNDLAARRYAAILVLLESGRPLIEACCEVANRLDKTTATEGRVKSISTGFAKCCNRPSLDRDSWLPFFVTGFNNWLNWEIKEGLFDNGICLEDFEDVLEQHAEWTFGNHENAVRFVRQHMKLVARAIMFLAPRIERERLNEQAR